MSNSAKNRRKISKLISVNCISPETFFPIYFWTCKDTLTFESTQDSALSKSSEVEIFQTKNWTKICTSYDWRYFFHLRKLIINCVTAS